MDKQSVLVAIAKIIAGDSDASMDVQAIFNQMPITLMEMANGPTSEVCFDELVKMAAHDVRNFELAEVA